MDYALTAFQIALSIKAMIDQVHIHPYLTVVLRGRLTVSEIDSTWDLEQY